MTTRSCYPTVRSTVVLLLAWLVAQACAPTEPRPHAETEIEPNGSLAKAMPIAFDTPIDGGFAFFDGVDCFRLHVVKTGTLTVFLTNRDTVGSSIGIEILTADSAGIDRNSNEGFGPGSTDVVGAVPVDPGDVWVRLSNRKIPVSGGYRLLATFTPLMVSDSQEPNGSRETAARLPIPSPLGGTVTATVGFTGDVEDWYFVDGAATTEDFQVTLTNLFPTATRVDNGTVGIVALGAGPTGEAESTQIGPGGSWTTPTFKAGVATRYYVIVRSYVLFGAAPYRLTVRALR